MSASGPKSLSGEQQKQADFWLIQMRGPLVFFLALLTIAGVYTALRMPTSVFPSTNFPRIVIGVENGIMPVEQMEVTATRPLEDAMNAVPGLRTVRSTTSRGSAEVSLFFDWNTDMAQALQLVNAELGKVRDKLPPTARFTTNRLTFATFPVLGYSLQSNTLSQTQLWELATYQLRPPLNRVRGVRTVTVLGGQVPEFDLVPDMARMQAAGVTIADLVNAVNSSNIVTSPGLYEEDHQQLLALVDAQAHDAVSLSQLTVRASASGVPIRLSDVAHAGPGVQPVYTAVTANGQPAVLLNIARQPTSNTVEVANGVAAEVAQLQTELPAGVTLTPFYNQADLVRSSLLSARDAILIGLALACAILFLFLRSAAVSLIAALVIPTTATITVLILWLLGESFNLMTLGGLAAAIGLVIDDAIVVIENIVQQREAGHDAAAAVRLALHEITIPLIGSTITPVVVFLPLVTVPEVTGSFLRALAVTMTVALLTSLVLALTFTPALSTVLLRTQPHNKPCALGMQRVFHFHEQLLRAVLQRPRWLAATAMAMCVLSYVGYTRLGSDLLPGMDEGAFVLDYIMPAGSSLAETNRVLSHVEHILQQTPEVSITTRRTGLQMGLAAVTETNTGDMTVQLKSHRSRSIDVVMAEVRAKIKHSEPELDVEFTQVLQDMIGDLSNAPEPIQIKLFSPDARLLQKTAPRVADAISRIDGVVDIENGVDNTVSGPATSFKVNPSLVTRLGFTPSDVAQDAASILDGVEAATPVIANGRPYPVRVRLGPEVRTSLDAVESTVFNSPTGKLGTLGSLATVQQVVPQHEVLRENLQQLVTVTARLEGTDLGTAMRRVQNTVEAMHLPHSVRVEYGGTYGTQQKSFRDLLRVLVLSLALVFGVLLTEFRNFSAPTAILASSVLSLCGVVGALWATGTSFNVSSFMGLIMVIGIVAKNGILLLDAEERYCTQGMAAREAMMEAARRRLRPILMTAAAAICGMLPLAFALGSGSEMLRPLAISVIGGLLLSMLLSLIVTPVLYYGLTCRQWQGSGATR